MTDSKAPTIICVASFLKGNDFIRECKRLGAAVVLLTREKLLDADWDRESLDDLIAIPGKTSVQSYLAAATYVARQRQVVRVVALEEYDIVTAAHIREHLCVLGMGTTTARCFQDKLAMRCNQRIDVIDISVKELFKQMKSGSFVERFSRVEVGDCAPHCLGVLEFLYAHRGRASAGFQHPR